MSISQKKTKGRGAVRGLAIGSSAVLLATVGFGGSPASAGTGTVAYSCKIFSTTFDYNAKVTMKGPAKPKVGKTVTITADLSALPGVSPVAVDSWRTTGKFTASGAQKGSINASGPKKKGPVKAKAKIPLGKITGKVKLKKAGKVTLTLGTLKITAVAFGSSVTMPCTPKKNKPLPKLLNLTVKR
ncbi:hypothetical protein [Actinocorallia sp. A-T 12471]|uniref:hypothetical protein n=1 Tax=Actinocorallia sp. A-T 12471 TaxID=3089813 RepID=UPI0029CF2178|nr:hypothetical protein [Actinocorallia sp. A-T 12471]MDX6739353.1 hypothetical protein [Actinocorallia sp. A-T 12471]